MCQHKVLLFQVYAGIPVHVTRMLRDTHTHNIMPQTEVYTACKQTDGDRESGFSSKHMLAVCQSHNRTAIMQSFRYVAFPDVPHAHR